MAMPDFPIDPELRIPARPPVVLRRTTEAVGFIRKMTLSRPGHAWRDVLQSFERLCGPRFTISLKRSTLIFSYPQAGRPITPPRDEEGNRCPGASGLLRELVPQA